MGTLPEKNYSQEYGLNSNSKPISLTEIILTLEPTFSSALAPGMKNNDSTMLLHIWVL